MHRFQESNSAVTRRIEAEKAARHIGTASVRLGALSFPYSQGLDAKNVARLKRLFQKQKEHAPGAHANRIPAAIAQATLDEALALSGLSAGQLKRAGDAATGHARLELPEGVQLECLRGRHRAAAASEVGGYGDKRWVVDLFLAGECSG